MLTLHDEQCAKMGLNITERLNIIHHRKKINNKNLDSFCSTSSQNPLSTVLSSTTLGFKIIHFMHANNIRGGKNAPLLCRTANQSPPRLSHSPSLTSRPSIIVHSNSFYAFHHDVGPLPSWLMKQVRECSSPSVSGLGATCALLSWEHQSTDTRGRRAAL